MVMQYKSPRGSWRDWRNVDKDKLHYKINIYKFRLLNKDRTKVLAEGSYGKVLKRLRTIEFFKHEKRGRK